MGIRTDLAIEKLNYAEKDSYFCEKNGNFELHFAEISDDENNRQSGNKYATLYFENLERITDFMPLEQQFLKAIKLLLKDCEKVLVVGLGNREITADSVGPKTAERILATRHITGKFAEEIGLSGLKSVAVTVPDVLGNTGIEVQEILKGTVEKIKVDAVIVIDALCAKSTDRIFKTIQLTDSGIAPGSGVKNKRKELNKFTLGVKVIAIGVPTVIDFPNDSENLVVTPKECDFLSTKISEVLSRCLNLYLQPNIDPEILFQLV